MTAPTWGGFAEDTAANWAAANQAPNNGEICVETDTGLVKYGNGSTPWATLPYRGGSVTDTYVGPGTFTWTKRPGARLVTLMLINAGSGGGSGRRGAAGTLRTGGAGGSGGARLDWTWMAAELLSTEKLVLGAAGTGGAAVATDDTNGNPGTAAGDSWFGGAGSESVSYIRAYTSGSNGLAGTNVGAAASGAQAGTTAGGPGGSSSATGGLGTNGNFANAGAAPGGGAGGGITSADVPAAGTPGGSDTPIQNYTQGGLGGGNSGGVGGNGVVVPITSQLFYPGGGGGGGGASKTSAAGAGGSGGTYGGGGGGGGASVNGFASGAGGAGGPAFARIVTYF